MHQHTIQKSITLQGIGLHSGQTVHLNLLPAPGNTGIVFVRTDLTARPAIRAHIANLGAKLRRTCLILDDSEVYTTEHLLSVCYAMNLSNLTIEMDGPEVPGMDGSAFPFYEAIKAVGLQAQAQNIPVLTLQQPIEVTQDKATLKAIPADHLHLEYLLDHDLPNFPAQKVIVDLNEATFAQELAPARTFVLKQEVEQLRRMGMGKGATTHNTLVVDEATGKPIDNVLRFPDEFPRHKMLDLVGDLALLGKRLNAHLIAYRSGHALNAKLVQELAKL